MLWCNCVVYFGVTEQTYYRWRKEYGGMRMAQAKRLQELEQENTRLKKLVAKEALRRSPNDRGELAYEGSL